MMLMDPSKHMYFTRWISDLNWRHLFIIIPPISLLVFLSLSSFTNINTNVLNPFSSRDKLQLNSPIPRDGESENRQLLIRSKIAVCLVGGARRFELTGPSIVDNILKEYPNSDLFLHSPLDENSFKFSLLKTAPKIASIRIFQPKPIQETESQVRVLTASGSPNGIQGLLQYFNLVEGCLTLIKNHQMAKNFTYDWIIRTRVDGYWNGPLDPETFVSGQYLVPPGSNFGGLNDRLGVGDLNTSTVALSRLSLIPKLNSTGYHQLNSESAFRAQLTIQGVPYITKRIPFCIVTDRSYAYPPPRYGVPVAALSSRGPLSGAKCRPCTPACEGSCVDEVMIELKNGGGWTDWENDTLKLCDAHGGEWERGWEKVYDRAAGKKYARKRKQMLKLKMDECVTDFDQMKRRTENWDSPEPEEICRLGLGT